MEKKQKKKVGFADIVDSKMGSQEESYEKEKGDQE